ncbi:hypothetical protein O181_013009 [Austropuccinia psidii MF-1]|uniref:J domain-containing protein n=1 Tax=Austropuccinia psidii MF-1 TaxID=1389203 RepID=A0A9Q3BVM3_9BASI|nr:hypothetical protein [Austropuccinia psidii MF-1]
MRRFASLIAVCFLVLLHSSVLAWDTEDYEIFDLVSALEAAEGKGTTFYKFLNVSKLATLNEINKAARKLSLSTHPDKHPGNKTIEAKFARLSLIVAILRDEEKRKRYNFFHDNGVPRWKGTGYMYSRWQPGLGFAISFILFVTTLMQYAAQHVNYRSDLKRIQRFQAAAKRAAYGGRIFSKDKKNEKDLNAQGRKKVKISLGQAMANNNQETSDDTALPAPKSRQERRRMQQAAGSSGGKQTQPGWLDMVVEGDDVWLVTEDGTELPLNESATSKPSLMSTFIPSTINVLIGRFFTKVPSETIVPDIKVTDEPKESSDSVGSANTTAVPEKSKPTNRKGAKSKK